MVYKNAPYLAFTVCEKAFAQLVIKHLIELEKQENCVDYIELFKIFILITQHNSE